MNYTGSCSITEQSLSVCLEELDGSKTECLPSKTINQQTDDNQVTIVNTIYKAMVPANNKYHGTLLLNDCILLNSFTFSKLT